MRNLKTWRLFNSVESRVFENYQSESEVARICEEYGIRNWSLERGLVNVQGSVDLRDRVLTHIPLKFGIVTGYFWCNMNNLTSLEGCPLRVGSSFDCDDLTSLEGCPKYVGDSFWCVDNNIREFTGIKYIEERLLCYSNPIGNIWDIISPEGKWDEDQMDLFEDLSVIQDDGEAVAIDRLNFFLEEIGLEPVDGVRGYINI